MLFLRRAHNTEHPSQGCPHLVLISQLSRLNYDKNCSHCPLFDTAAIIGFSDSSINTLPCVELNMLLCCFIAKILEKLVLSQVSSYLNSHNLYNTCQSAYRPGHSTETALLKVVNDLFLSLNKGNISVLALLDFSSAFDTIDHTILVHRLHTDFGFTDTDTDTDTDLLDPIPSKLLIECLDSILPSLTDLFNSSLASGIFPQCFKSALVTPILKKRCLDHNDLNNYRPVSNLCFIAKILEKLVLSQVSSYLNSHNLYNTCQSAYRPGHSTETALLKVVNDLFLSLNKGNISVLALLDFSSAFDTIDHTILVHRLHTDFGFTDTVLQWFSSYLTDRTHYVSLCNHCSDFAPVHSGVPQGSVLGPILFTMYIKPLSAIIDSHSIIHHSFADDLQLQMSAPPDRISELLHSMQSCISDVKAWATVNMLRLNDSKTELMLVTSKRSKHLHNLPTSITIGNAQIPFKQSVKNLGFTLDCHLTMNAHVSNIARTCYFELRRLAYIRRFLTSTATATLVSAFVLSRIDYCNSLLFGSTLDVTSHLQRIQNYAARVILRLPMSSRITIHLKSLHWLPVKVRSTYKIACLCYHCHSSTAPSYVTDMLHKKPLHTRNTRSSSYTMPLLNRPAHSKATLGDRSFSFASSSVWNSIPNDVKCAPSLSSFKSRLKTYLFRSVYKD